MSGMDTNGNACIQKVLLILSPVGVFLLWRVGPTISHWLFEGEKDKSWSTLGQIGDSFGAINALIQAFVFIAIAVTTWLAYKESRDSREDSQAQLIELKAQTSALKQQNDNLVTHRSILEKQLTLSAAAARTQSLPVVIKMQASSLQKLYQSYPQLRVWAAMDSKEIKPVLGFLDAALRAASNEKVVPMSVDVGGRVSQQKVRIEDLIHGRDLMERFYRTVIQFEDSLRQLDTPTTPSDNLSASSS